MYSILNFQPAQTSEGGGEKDTDTVYAPPIIFWLYDWLFSFETPPLDPTTFFLKEGKDPYYCLGVFIAVQKGVLEYFIRQLRRF